MKMSGLSNNQLHRLILMRMGRAANLDAPRGRSRLPVWRTNMANPTPVKWSLEADYLQACNCDYGCPCEFEAPPTRGFCDGMGAWRINRGRHSDLSLDGLALGFVAHWPGALHEGNGTLALFFEQKANPQQREALMRIATGQEGGMPFEIIAKTISKLLEMVLAMISKGMPPSWPVAIRIRASRCWGFAFCSKNSAKVPLPSCNAPGQWATKPSARPSSDRSLWRPRLMRHAPMPSQKPRVGGASNSHGQP